MKMRTLTNIKGIMLMLSLLLMLGTTGCIFSPDDGEGDGPVDREQQYPDTPTKLMENFVEVYEEMMIDEFRDMLHPDYQTILLNSTITDWGWDEGATYDRDDEIIIHENMFGGNTGLDHNDLVINPLDNIVVDLFEQGPAWIQVSEDDINFPGSQMALFDVKIIFNDNSGTHAFIVDQEVRFYVEGVEDGGRTKFMLRGQIGSEPSH